MPTYAYKCAACGHTFDKFQRFSEDPITTCPNLHAKDVEVLYQPGPDEHQEAVRGQPLDRSPRRSGRCFICTRRRGRRRRRESGQTRLMASRAFDLPGAFRAAPAPDRELRQLPSAGGAQPSPRSSRDKLNDRGAVARPCSTAVSV
jgi:putative FmdB family regulatory protein